MSEGEHRARKRRWGRIVSLSFLFLLALLVIVHALWGKVEADRVRREVARLKSTGEPMAINDFRDPPLPDEQNIAAVIRSAGSHLVEDGFAERELNFADDLRLPLSPREREVMDIYLGQQAASFAELDLLKGRTRSASLDEPEVFPSFNHARSLAELGRNAALAMADQGRFDLAMDHLDRVSQIAQVATGNQGLVGMLVATGCRAMHDETLMNIVPYLHVGSAAGEVSPERIRAQIATLLDEKPARNDLRRALQFERFFLPDLVDKVQSGKSGYTLPGNLKPMNPVLAYALSPMARRAKFDCMQYLSESLRIEPSLKDFGDYRRQSAAAAVMLAKGRAGYNIYSRMLMSDHTRLFLTYFRAQTGRRVTATMLALRLFQADNGHYPQTLDELVPAYLPAVPGDGEGDNELIHYRAAPQPIVWSVGANCKNDGGAEAPLDKNEYDERVAADFVRHLTPTPRKAEQWAAFRAEQTAKQNEDATAPSLASHSWPKDVSESLFNDLAGTFTADAEGQPASGIAFVGKPIWIDHQGERWILVQLTDPRAENPNVLRCLFKAEPQIDGTATFTPFELIESSRWDALMMDASSFFRADFKPGALGTMYFNADVGYAIPDAGKPTFYIRVESGGLFIGEVPNFDWKSEFQGQPAKYVLTRKEEPNATP